MVSLGFFVVKLFYQIPGGAVLLFALQIRMGLLLASFNFLYSQDIKAVTENGKKVILHDNGQWSFIKTNENIHPNLGAYTKNIEATSFVDSKIKTLSFWYNPNNWNVEKLTDGSAEYQFSGKNEELYARIITEKINVPKDLMRQIIESNARKAAQVFDPIEESEINVNGIPVNLLKVKVEIQGMKLVFIYYYFSSEIGTIQLFCYTSQEIMEEYEETILDFMNGIVIK